jgi:hypothetical protein
MYVRVMYQKSIVYLEVTCMGISFPLRILYKFLKGVPLMLPVMVTGSAPCEIQVMGLQKNQRGCWEEFIKCNKHAIQDCQFLRKAEGCEYRILICLVLK